MSRAKVVIFIVEGITDKETLEGILTELYESKNIVFEVIRGDITAEKEVKVNTIKAKIGEKVKETIKKYKIKESDIESIIHIVDMDGAYISEENVIFKPNVRIKYTEEKIETENRERILQRNKEKSLILNILNSIEDMTINRRKIKYRMYYMSCNLEHVMYNKLNLSNEEKNKLAMEFEDSYIDNPIEFVKFIGESKFSINKEYKESWEFIKKDTNSLKRYSNFIVFFNENKI